MGMKTLHAILKQAVLDVLANSPGVYTATVTVELSGFTTELTVDCHARENGARIAPDVLEACAEYGGR